MGGSLKRTSSGQMMTVVGAAIGLGALLSVSAWLLAHKTMELTDAEPVMQDVRVELNYGGLRAAAGALSEADGTLRYLVAMRDDAHRGLLHKGRREVLQIPDCTCDFGDPHAEVMREVARQDADMFMGRYTRNGGLTK